MLLDTVITQKASQGLKELIIAQRKTTASKPIDERSRESPSKPAGLALQLPGSFRLIPSRFSDLAGHTDHGRAAGAHQMKLNIEKVSSRRDRRTLAMVCASSVSWDGAKKGKIPSTVSHK